MNEIIQKVEHAIQLLFEHDSWLLIHDLSEQSITHKLAVHLQSFFPDYDVDCEYNGNVERGNGRKLISLLKSRLKESGFLKKREENIDEETIDRSVFPDIIVHKRGSNKDNLVIIEVKKMSSNVPREYDFLKLGAYTSGENGNDLKYNVGVFLDFNKVLGYQMEVFQNGEKVEKSKSRRQSTRHSPRARTRSIAVSTEKIDAEIVSEGDAKVIN